MKKTISLFLSLATMFIFVACGGGGDSTTGYLVDAPVQGVKYINENGKTGFTDEKGKFIYSGGTIKFYVGRIEIGSTTRLNKDKILMLQEILGLNRNVGTDNALLLKTATLLQSLDTDPATDIIELGDNFKLLDKEKYNKHIKDIDVNELLATLNIPIKKQEDVIKHLNASIEKYLKRKDYEQDTKETSETSRSTFLGTIAVDDDVVITYPTTIFPDSLNDATITCQSSSNLYGCEISEKRVNGKNLILKFKTLAYNTEYKITINDKLKDFANKSLDKIVIFKTTSNQAGVKPEIKKYEYKNGEIVVEFNKKMDDSTINSTNISLVSKEDKTKIPLVINLNGKKVTIKPANILITNKEYILTISKNVKDTNGLFLKENSSYTFTTNEEISYKGFTYKVIQSPITQRYWLDRNIGATTVCDSRYVGLTEEGKNNSSCYGDYFQWGRKANGHEKSTSEVIDTTQDPIVKDVETNGKFATWGTGKKSPDWRKFPNNDLWSGAEAINNPCPAGFRVPTIDELLVETKDVDELLFPKEKVSGGYETLQNFLKFPPAGFRKYNTRDGIVELSSYSGNVWSSSTGSTNKMAYTLDFYPGGIDGKLSAKAQGYSLRCIKDYKSNTKPLSVVSTTPNNGAKNVDVNSTITVIFSKPVLIESSYRSRFTIMDITNNKEMSIDIVRKISPTTYELPLSPWQGDRTPSGGQTKMKYNTTYKVIFNKTIKDANGKSIVAEPIRFTTEKKPSEQNVSILKSNVKNGATNVSRNESIRIYFSKDIDKTTLTKENITLKDASNNNIETTLDYKEINLDKWDKTLKDRILTISPKNSLNASTSYNLSLKNIKDADGLTLVDSSLNFTTKSQNDISDTKGNIYNTVISPKTSKVWLDRNLGATRVCQTNNDIHCVGTYFRLEDQNNSICPTGFRVPSYEELYSELDGVSLSDLNSNFLKIPDAGKQGSSDAYLSSSSQGDKYNTKKVLYIPTYLLEDKNENISSSIAVRCIKGN